MRNVERRCFDQQGERMRENKRKARENEGTIQASTAKNRSSENENYEASIEKNIMFFNKNGLCIFGLADHRSAKKTVGIYRKRYQLIDKLRLQDTTGLEA
jgi:hypothetical protein